MLLQLILKDLFKFFKIGLYYDGTIRIGVLIKFIIFLVIIFSCIKFSERLKSCYDGVIICATFIQLCFILFRFLLLLIIVIKYDTAVLRTNIRSLAI